MDFAIGSLLLLGKWLLIGLIYLMLLIILLNVRREMKQRLANPELISTSIPGRLRILESGGDPTLTPGHILNLPTEMIFGADKKQLKKEDLTIQNRFVSGRHAKLSWDGANWWLTDLGSSNGSFVNGRQCPPDEKVYVPIGGTIQIGDVIFELLS
jgi:pSer/pThr/pTyr-binding forkhead associated (FHA) protein